METIRAAAAIIERDGRVLAALRKDGLEGAGWEFPGGKLREGETAEAACRREVAEELGVRLSTAWPLDTFEHVIDDATLSMDVFVAMLAPGEEPRPLEHAELRWLAQDELMGVSWLPIDAQVASTLGFYWNDVFSPSHL